MTKPTVLVVDDDRLQIFTIQAALNSIAELVPFQEPDKALEWLRQCPKKAVCIVSDLAMPTVAVGDAFLKGVRLADPAIPIILRTGEDPGEPRDTIVRTYRVTLYEKGVNTADDLRAFVSRSFPVAS